VAGQDRAVWARREVSGPQRLFYKVSLYRRDGELVESLPGEPSTDIDQSRFEALLQLPVKVAMDSLVAHARDLSADSRGFAVQLIKQLNDPNNRDVALI